MMLAILVLVLMLPHPSISATIHVRLEVRATWINPDGFFRLAIVANNSIPAPTLRGRVGDELVVDVVNMMSDAVTSLHWHGLLLDHPMWDGASMVSQYPIPPGQRCVGIRCMNNTGQ
jgi:FtsP/CotA-like multicopper oxidase with cupredoxin domain